MQISGLVISFSEEMLKFKECFVVFTIELTDGVMKGRLAVPAESGAVALY